MSEKATPRWAALHSYLSGKISLRDMLGPFILGTPHGDAALKRALGGGENAAGMHVSEESALNLSAVWAAVNVIAGDIGSLPLHHYRKNGRGKDKFTDSPLYYLLHDQPNPEMTSAVFRETMQTYALLWGNAVAEIQWTNGGWPSAIWPLEPWRVSYDRVYSERTGTRRLVYRVTRASGPPSILEAEDVLHVPALTSNGVWGRSTVSHARQSIGLGLATERFGGAFFGNGSTFGGILSHPTALGDTAKENLRQAVEGLHKGVDRAHKFLVLEEGTKYERLGIPPEDAQFLETRQFGVTEIARWFGVPPHKIGDLSRATFTNIEQQSLDYVTFTLRKWLVRWEQELNRKLIGRLERDLQTIEFNLDGLLRGDTAARVSYYTSGRQWGWLSPNDIRELDGMNPLPGDQGDVYLVPTNMIPADRLDDVIDKQVAPAPAPVVAPPAAPAPAAADDEKRKRDLALAHRAIVADVVRRMLKRESDKVASVAKDPAFLSTFYESFAKTFRAAILPACRMHVAMLNGHAGGQTAEALADELVAGHVAYSKRALSDCKSAADIDAEVERWQLERLNDIPDTLQRGQSR